VWLRRYFSSYASALGTLFFWFVPYRFLTYFVTFQFGAIVANSFFPLLLLGLDTVLSEMKQKRSRKLLGFVAAVIGLTGMILSHLVTVLVYLPFLFVYVIYSLHHISFSKNQIKNSLQKILPLLCILLLSAGITAYYWLPATMELSWIKAGQQAIVEYKDHFPTLKQLIVPSWGYGYSEAGTNDGISFQAGVAQWLVFICGFIVAVLMILKKNTVITHLLNKKLLCIGLLSFGIYLIFSSYQFNARFLWNFGYCFGCNYYTMRYFIFTTSYSFVQNLFTKSSTATYVWFFWLFAISTTYLTF
jgi:hypothetical protein